MLGATTSTPGGDVMANAEQFDLTRLVLSRR
jgi:hypothetical protein